ncbi:hypothetical protein [Mycobacterium paraintracellulare]|uniref:hypothetical protein n=1 Tax=Mycobacterium paraintracellulare TaxID=1138383 RepID=UPI001F19E2A2|nr:hypothetical protein [Mycobacterium paraintracellulare]
MFDELGRRLVYELGNLGDPDSSTDDDVLAVLLASDRTGFDEVAAVGWAEAPRELSAPWVDDSIRRGAVSIPHGHHVANVNHLTNKDDIDVVTGMVRYSGIPVSLRPA